jgi:uncharacterized OB-fold protein
VVRTDTLSEQAGSGERCRACGAALADDQDWCLECGAARTMLRRPPDWRIPAVVIGVVIALAVVALLIALVSLSIQANHP